MKIVRNSTLIMIAAGLVMLLGGVSALVVENYVQAGSILMLGLIAIIGQITIRSLSDTL